MIYRLSRDRKFNLFIVFTMVVALLGAPAAAEAGILGKTLQVIRPFASVAGKVAGAIAGATLCAGFVPPLGMLAGAVGGWIVGGIVTNYGTASLGNLASIGGAALGVMALSSFGPVGYVGGALVGGWLGKTAMNLLQKTDRKTTGGILFMTGNQQPAATPAGPVALSPEIPASFDQAPSPVATNVEAAATAQAEPTSEEVRNADAAYQKAYQTYVSATREGSSDKIAEAHKAYLEAFASYKALTGKNPKN